MPLATIQYETRRSTARSYKYLDALTTAEQNPAHEFAIHFQPDPTGESVPSITLDFGREVTGRIQTELVRA